MNDSFEMYGYLSAESEQFRTDQHARTAVEFAMVRSTAATAMIQLRSMSTKESEPETLVALCLWLRCMESCQGVVLLVERGMVPSAMALLRTAYECLFYAAALLRKPALADKMEKSHHAARVKQAKQMLNAGALDRVDPQRIADLEDVATHSFENDSFTAWDAASVADLRFEYETAYRGLGLAGAHATLRSLDPYFEARTDGSASLIFSPDLTRVAWVLGLVNSCMECGLQRLRNAGFN